MDDYRQIEIYLGNENELITANNALWKSNETKWIENH